MMILIGETGTKRTEYFRKAAESLQVPLSVVEWGSIAERFSSAEPGTQKLESQNNPMDEDALWGTFHPQMTSLENFVSQCKKLSEWKVSYCVGAVGVPEQIRDIQKLREKLGTSVYLWINKMDGLGRNYTEEEIKAFIAVDPWFELELKHHPADGKTCGNQVFVEADGSLRRCNLCRPDGKNLYEADTGICSAKAAQGEGEKQVQIFDIPACSMRECSCYLAYNNRLEKELLFFQPYPAFRIPTYPKAVFLDIDGTILPEGRRSNVTFFCNSE